MKEILFELFLISECPASIPESFRNVKITKDHFAKIDYCLPNIAYITDHENLYDFITELGSIYRYYESQLDTHIIDELVVEKIYIKGKTIDIFIGS